jgi:hypothetical protein
VAWPERQRSPEKRGFHLPQARLRQVKMRPTIKKESLILFETM